MPRLNAAHSARGGSLSRGTARDRGQLPWVIDTPLYPSAVVTGQSVARQWSAWLSPTRATVASASGARAPNSQAIADWSGEQGAEGISTACDGVGVTMVR